jgi:hypothetical protein
VTGHKKSTLIAHLIKEHLDRECFSAAPDRSTVRTKRPRALQAARHFQGGAR